VSTTPAGPRSYESLTVLKAEAVAAGLECDTWNDHHTAVAAEQSGLCGESSEVTIYATPTDLADGVSNWEAFAKVGRKDDPDYYRLVVGPNWTIKAPKKQAVAVAEELKGELKE
jgi:hypothetical protein